MDNTTLTILGMLAAFITAAVTAFLAEPVKTYFENINKINHLKLAIYKELLINYKQFEGYYTEREEIKETSMKIIMENAIRTECYKHAIENELTLFYQLPESIPIGGLYNTFLNILQKPKNDEIFDHPIKKIFPVYSQSFVDFIDLYFYKGVLDKNLLKK